MTRGGAFSNTGHLMAIREEMHGGQKNRDAANDATLKGLVGNIKGTKPHLILRAKNTGTWINIHGTTVTGTVLPATEFCYFLCACYNVTPLNFHRH